MPLLDGRSLVVNITPGEGAIVRRTLPHMLATHKAPFDEVVVVVDRTPRTRRLAELLPASSDVDNAESFDHLKNEVPDLRLLDVDYSRSLHERLARKWFGRSRMPVRCAGGTPIYAFIFGLEAARCRYRVHSDCDMLIFDPGPVSWLEGAAEVLRTHDDVLFVSQIYGPSRAAGPDTRAQASDGASPGRRVDPFPFSTGCFLYDEEKLWSAIGRLRIVKHTLYKQPIYALQGRSASHALEDLIAFRLAATGYSRFQLDERFGFKLHAWDKAFFNHPDMASTIQSVERGEVPNWQIGDQNLVRPWNRDDLLR